MNDAQTELITKLKAANNILVTVSANPSVDQLAACIGLTILLNKMKKHATAVFSGTVPSTIQFLKPEETLEKNTDSLRDFIISLDKAKADKLRYKVEENIVKIFITPYKTSIGPDDLEFSQGDFNVDVVLALGVHEQQDLDQAITAHGRILHDAVVLAVNTAPGGELGLINWTVPAASSLSELAVEMADALAREEMDGQIATALLTGIVAETARFSNEKTSPDTMRLSAELMSAGANQQLVASELEQQPVLQNVSKEQPAAEAEVNIPESNDGSLNIIHKSEEEPEPETESKPKPTVSKSAPNESDPLDKLLQSTTADTSAKVSDSEADTVETTDKTEPTSAMPLLPPSQLNAPHHMVTPPSFGARSVDEPEENAGGLPAKEPDVPMLDRDAKDRKETSSTPPAIEKESVPLELPTPVEDEPVDTVPTSTAGLSSFQYQPLASEPKVAEAVTPEDDPTNTLADIERSVNSPHVAEEPDTAVPLSASQLDAAHNAVLDAYNSVPPSLQTLPPKADVGASGYLNVHDLPGMEEEYTAAPQPPAAPIEPTQNVDPVPYIPEPTPGTTPADTPLTMPMPTSFAASEPAPEQTSAAQAPLSPSLPPPVPPPMTGLPPFQQ